MQNISLIHPQNNSSESTQLFWISSGAFVYYIPARTYRRSLHSPCSECFHSTQYPTDILARPLRHIQRRYPEYVPSRNRIWENRGTFRAYEAALKASAILDGVLPSGIPPEPEPSDEKSSKGKGKSRSVDEEVEVKDKKAAAVRKAKVTVKLFDEVYDRWADYNGLRAQGVRLATGSERFEPGKYRECLSPIRSSLTFDIGYVLTRAVYKGVKAFKVLRQPDRELHVLQTLLDQTYWCTGLRGSWHIQKIGILVAMMGDDAEASATKAITACMEGLKDVGTGLGAF